MYRAFNYSEKVSISLIIITYFHSLNLILRTNNILLLLFRTRLK